MISGKSIIGDEGKEYSNSGSPKNKNK